MTRSEYEQRRRALEQQLQADLELVRAAHEVRVRSLDQLWQRLGEGEAASPSAEPVPASPPPPAAESVPIPGSNGTLHGIGTQSGIGTQAPPAQTGPVRRGYGVVEGEVEEALSRLPEVFDKHDLVRELGYEPPRSTLHRVLQNLQMAGRIAIRSHSEGRTRTIYRKARNPEPEGA